MVKLRSLFKRSVEKKNRKNPKTLPLINVEGDVPLEEEMIQRVNLSSDEINNIRSYEEDEKKLVEQLEAIS